MKSLPIFYLAFILFSCGSDPYNCKLDTLILAMNDSILQIKGADEAYNSMLDELGEPELYNENVKSYRLLITYSWDRYAWVYRFTKHNSGGRMVVKKLYHEYYKDGSSLSDTTIHRELSKQQWSEFEHVFGSNCFWTLPHIIDRVGLDGRNCVLEAYDPFRKNPVDKNYFVAVRWSPETNTRFRRICDYIESLEPNEF